MRKILRKKKYQVLVFTLGLFFCLMMAIPIIASAESEIVLKIEHNDKVDSNSDRMIKEFAAEVYKKTDGRVKIEIFPYCSLSGGSAMTSYQNVQIGAVDGALMYTSLLSAWDYSLQVLSLPFIFSGIDDLEKVRHSNVFKKMLSNLELLNLKGIDGWSGCLRQMVNNVREIRTPKDLKGLKIRVPENELWVSCFKELGAAPIPLPFSEIPTAMQLGTIDGAERPTEHLFVEKWWEMAKYVTFSNYSGDMRVLCFNLQKWQELPEDVKNIIISAANKAGDSHYRIERDGENEVIKKLKEHGMIVTNLSSEEVQQFKDAMKPVWDAYSEKIGLDIINGIKDVLK